LPIRCVWSIRCLLLEERRRQSRWEKWWKADQGRGTKRIEWIESNVRVTEGRGRSKEIEEGRRQSRWENGEGGWRKRNETKGKMGWKDVRIGSECIERHDRK
jgi:hypothetical protein